MLALLASLELITGQRCVVFKLGGDHVFSVNHSSGTGHVSFMLITTLSDYRNQIRFGYCELTAWFGCRFLW